MLKAETMVLASNDITLTLPAITASDNGWEMTVKNVGSHTHLVTVIGDAGATIDGKANSKLTRYQGHTFVASGGNWVLKEKQISIEKTVGIYSYNFPKKHRIHFLICLIIQS